MARCRIRLSAPPVVHARRLRARPVLLALAAGHLFAACSGPEPPGAGAVELRVPIYSWVSHLDPLKAGHVEAYNVVRQLYEGLVDYDPATFEPVPGSRSRSLRARTLCTGPFRSDPTSGSSTTRVFRTGAAGP